MLPPVTSKSLCRLRGKWCRFSMLVVRPPSMRIDCRRGGGIGEERGGRGCVRIGLGKLVLFVI